MSFDEARVVGEDRGGDRLRGPGSAKIAKVQIEDVSIVRWILRADLLETRTADELHRGVGSLTKKTDRSRRWRRVRMKRGTQKNVSPECADSFRPIVERISARVVARRNDERDVYLFVFSPARDDGLQVAGDAADVSDDVSADTTCLACGLRPRTDGVAFDDFYLIAPVKTECFAPKLLACVFPAQLGACRTRSERYSSRCGTMLMSRASLGV